MECVVTYQDVLDELFPKLKNEKLGPDPNLNCNNQQVNQEQEGQEEIQPLPQDVKLALKTFHGKYLGVVDKEVVGDIDYKYEYLLIWVLERCGGHYFSLKFVQPGAPALFLSTNDDHSVCTSFTVGPYENWEIWKNGKNRYLRNVKTERYLCVEPNSKPTPSKPHSTFVVCDRTKPKKWECFKFIKISYQKERTAAMESFHGTYLHFDDQHTPHATRKSVNHTELMTFQKWGLYWTIKTSNGGYIGATPDGAVYNSLLTITDNEKWIKEKQGNHASYYKSFHGKYLCADPNGKVTADRDVPKKWELWKHQWIN